MADNTKLQYIVELLTQGDTKKATDELKKLEASGKATSSSMADVGRQFQAAFAVIAGSQFLAQSVQAFLEAERSVAKLNAALQSTGQFTPEVSESMQELAKAMAQTSTYADEAIVNVIAKLTAMGARTQDVERLTRAVLDLSTLMDRDLNRATLAFSQALNGNVESLRAAGIQIDDTRTATEQFNDALVQIEQRAGGQAAAAVDTLGGKFEVLNKNLGEIKESIGGVILQFGEPFLKALNDASKAVADFAEKNRGMLSTLLGIANPGLGLARSLLQANQQPAAPATQYQFPLTAESNAALMRATGQQAAPVTTPALQLKDELAALEEKWRLEDQIVKSINEEHESRALIARLADEDIASEIAAFRNGERIKQDLIDQTVLTMLEGDARVMAEMEINQDRRLQMIEEQEFYDQEQKDAAIRAVRALGEEERRKFEQSRTYSFKLKQDMQQVAQSGAQAFSSGLAGAIVSAFEEGDKAFQKFAANFFRTMAEMIFQAMILRAVKGALGLSDGGQVTAMASGGMIYAANGVSGVSDVSSPTFFPKFNVLAGEAGREVMTVLARPRFERINGVPAQIGYAGGNRLAITSADALARGGGGAGGMVDIRVTLSPEVKAEIVNQSVQNARVAVVQDMSTDSQLSRVTRQKVS